MLTDEVRKFTDDDVRAAVKLLEATDFDVDLAVAYVAPSASPDQALAAGHVLHLMGLDYAAAKQLLIVTHSFREILGLQSS